MSTESLKWALEQKAFQRVDELNKDKEEDVEKATKTQADYKPLKAMPFFNNKDKALKQFCNLYLFISLEEYVLL